MNQGQKILILMDDLKRKAKLEPTFEEKAEKWKNLSYLAVGFSLAVAATTFAILERNSSKSASSSR